MQDNVFQDGRTTGGGDRPAPGGDGERRPHGGSQSEGREPRGRRRPSRSRRSRQPAARTAPTLGRGLQLSSIAIPFLTVMVATAFCYFARPVLLPLVTALTFAYVLSPGVDFLARLNIPRTAAVFVVLCLAAGAMGALGFVIIDQAQDFVGGLPEYWRSLQTMLGDPNSWIGRLPEPLRNMLPASDADIWTQLSRMNVSGVTGTLFSGIGSAVSFLVWGLLVSFLTLFIMLDMPQMYTRLVRLLGEASEHELRTTLSQVDHQLRTYLAVKISTSAALGVVATIGLVLLDVPYAYIWGPLVGLLNIIPYVGSIISAIPPIIVVVIHTGSIMPGVWVALFILVLQQLEGNLITPKIIGDQVKLNVVAVLISTVFWGWLWGAIGVLLATPITAAIKVVCERIEPLRPIATVLG